MKNNASQNAHVSEANHENILVSYNSTHIL